MLASQLRSHSPQQLVEEIRHGGRFVVFEYCISLILVTFRRRSEVYFLRPGESATGPLLTHTLASLLFGWWGIPWGPIFTIAVITTNLGGGKDITNDVLQRMGIDPRALFAAPPGYGGAGVPPEGYGEPNAAPSGYGGPPPAPPSWGAPAQGSSLPARAAQSDRSSGGNRLAAAGLLFGVLGLLIPVVSSFLGLILSALGLRKAARDPLARGRAVAIAGIVVSCLTLALTTSMVWRTMRGVQQGHASRSGLVTSAALKLSEGQPVAGNTLEAVAMSRTVKVFMDKSIQDGVRPRKGSRLSTPPAGIQVYCERHKKRCLLIVKVPDLRRYSSQAKDSVLQGVWRLACALLGKEEVELAVVLRGAILTDSAVRGQSARPNFAVRVRGNPDDAFAIFFRPDPPPRDSLTSKPATQKDSVHDQGTSGTKEINKISRKQNV